VVVVVVVLLLLLLLSSSSLLWLVAGLSLQILGGAGLPFAGMPHQMSATYHPPPPCVCSTGFRGLCTEFTGQALRLSFWARGVFFRFCARGPVVCIPEPRGGEVRTQRSQTPRVFPSLAWPYSVCTKAFGEIKRNKFAYQSILPKPMYLRMIGAM